MRNGGKTIRYAIVTGAAKGIGRATAKLLYSEGWFVGAFDRDRRAIDSLGSDLSGDRGFSQVLDVCDQYGWIGAIGAFSEKSGGKLDLLVNNAGVAALGSFRDTPLETSLRIIEINVIGTIISINACLPLLEATSNARIVNISSIAALSGWPQGSIYSASKAAIYNLTEALAAELSACDIAVGDILPSFVDTGLIGEDDEVAVVREALSVIGVSWSQPERVARAVFRATKSSRIHHTVGSQARLYSIIARLVPSLARLVSRKIGKRVARESAKVRSG